MIDIQTAAELLLAQDNIVILAHKKPDGDTLGSSFALLYALESLGKTARVECADEFPPRYSFIYPIGGYIPSDFPLEFVVAVDAAAPDLLGDKGEKYAGKISLCIDHHKSNVMYAKETLLDAKSPATAQIMFELIQQMGVSISGAMADAMFTGISTDTGCFKYESVTQRTHTVAGQLISFGARHGLINKLMFDTLSRGRLKAERIAFSSLAYYFDEQCAMIVLPEDLASVCEVDETELDGLSSFPVRIQGVHAGVTVRIKQDGEFRMSLRTVGTVDASLICANFGGGGHRNAGGCTIKGELEDVKKQVTAAVKIELDRNGI